MSLNQCVSDSINSIWYVDIRLQGIQLTQYPFFNGVGYNLDGLSYPSNSDWYNGINEALMSLSNYGYSYYLTDTDEVVVINNICSLNSSGILLEINVGIEFTISCN